jgi:hypothetical protein
MHGFDAAHQRRTRSISPEYSDRMTCRYFRGLSNCKALSLVRIKSRKTSSTDTQGCPLYGSVFGCTMCYTTSTGYNVWTHKVRLHSQVYPPQGSSRQGLAAYCSALRMQVIEMPPAGQMSFIISIWVVGHIGGGGGTPLIVHKSPAYLLQLGLSGLDLIRAN